MTHRDPHPRSSSDEALTTGTPNRTRETRSVGIVGEADRWRDAVRAGYALTLAANSGDTYVDILTEGMAPDATVEVWRFPVDRRATLRSMVRCAQLLPAPGGGARARAQQYLDSLGLPALFLQDDASRDVLHVAPHPTVVTARNVGGTIQLEIDGGAALQSAPQLTALADQLQAAVGTALHTPDTTLEAAARNLPPSFFDLTIASNVPVDSLRPPLEKLAWSIGLPLRLSTVQLGELPAATPRELPEPSPRGGATIILVPGASTPLRELHASTPTGMQSTVGHLPTGAPIYEHRSNETRELYDEIFRRRCYLSSGLVIPTGATVVDVGANIGLFALFCHQEAPSVTVHAVEPVAELADLVEANATLYDARVRIHRCALGDRRCTRELSYYPEATLQSGFYADLDRDTAVARSYAAHHSSAMPAVPALDARVRGELNALVERRLRPQTRSVEVQTLSGLIADQQLNQIDLLKVDVERAELEVLAGLDPNDWSRIQQVAIEVHDVGGRLETIRNQLQSHGFDTWEAQDERFAGTELRLLFASRSEYKREQAHRTARADEPLATAAATWVERCRYPVYSLVVPRAGRAGSDAQDALRERLRAIPSLTAIEAADLTPTEATLEDFGSETVSMLARHLLRIVTAPIRPPTKALAVDADGILWDGICGEVGPQEVRVDAVSRYIQRLLLEQKAAGRLLLLLSKNDLQDVRAVFDTNPDMLLKMEDFAGLAVDWAPKPANLAREAQRLGIGLESVVFIDDSPSERAEMAVRLPQVVVAGLGTERSEFPKWLRDTWALDVAKASNEDALRLAFHQQENRRLELAELETEFPAYLAALDMTVDIRSAVDADIERISQLSMRTNQFNLMLRRSTTADIRVLLAQVEITLVVSVRDRFGDYGLVGFVAAKVDGTQLRVTDFMLSCRALGRNVEWAMLQNLGHLAARMPGLTTLRLNALVGERNRPAHNFLHAIGALCDGTEARSSCEVHVPLAAADSLDWRQLDPYPEAPADQPEGSPPPVAGRLYQWPTGDRMPSSALDTSERARPELAVPYAAPRTEVEARVATLWQRYVGVVNPGIHDDLLASGGDSIVAITLCHRLADELRVEVPVHAFLQKPTIHGLAQLVDGARGSATAPTRVRQGPGLTIAATYGQQRVWAAQAAGQAAHQIIPLVYEIHGTLDPQRLEAALQQVIDRHDSLHTTLALDHGQVVQKPWCDPLVLERRLATDAADAHHLQAEFLARPFAPAACVPLRAMLATIDAQSHVLALALNHSAADGWSIGLIQRDLSRAYAADCAKPWPGSGAPSFLDYARTRGAIGTRQHAPAEPDSPAPVEPMRTTSPTTGQAPEPSTWRFDIPNSAVRAVDEATRRLGVSRASILLGAFHLWLAVHSSRSRTTVGCPVANRTSAAEQEAVGFFANIVPTTIDALWSECSDDYLRRIGRTMFDALRRGDIPYGQLIELRDERGGPARHLFEALFTYQPTPSHQLRLPGCSVAPGEPGYWPVPFEFMLDVEEHRGSARGLVRWNARLHPASVVRGLAEGFPLAAQLLCRLHQHPIDVTRRTLLDVASDHRVAAAHDAIEYRRSRLQGLRAKPAGRLT